MFVPTRIIFGSGRINELHSQNLPGKKALLTISNGKSARESGALAKVESELTHALDAVHGAAP